MLVRALIVLLAVLNLGVATWWIASDPQPAAAAVAQPAGVARLQLVGEGVPVRKAAPMVENGASGAVDVASATTPSQCYSLGPFASRQAADAGSASLRSMVRKVTLRTEGQVKAQAWRVFLPPLASLAEAQATAQRIVAAGFNDYIVVREGPEANSIALGRYRNEQSATRHAKTLAAAGFAATVAPVGPTQGEQAIWLDLIADASFDAVRAQAATNAAQHRRVECAAQQ